MSSLRTAVDAAAEIQAAKRARSLAAAGSGALSKSLSAMELDGHGARYQQPLCFQYPPWLPFGAWHAMS